MIIQNIISNYKIRWFLNNDDNIKGNMNIIDYDYNHNNDRRTINNTGNDK